MPPADSSVEEGGLYQPPRPPLPAPTPYTHPTPPVLPPTPVRPPSFARQAAPAPTTSTFVGVPLPGLAAAGPPPPAYHAAPQPLPLTRYQPFQPTPEYRPPPNPRVGPAGLPPSVAGAGGDAAAFLPPLGGPGSLSCPTSLSLQGVQASSQPRTSASGLAGGTTVPGPGCWSLPRDAAGGSQDPSPPSDAGPGPAPPAPVASIPPLGAEELKTRSLPTRYLHGSRQPGSIGRRPSPFAAEGGAGAGDEEGFLFGEAVPEEGEEDLYGSSEDLSSGPSILEKLMVWAYYNNSEDDADEDLAEDEEEAGTIARLCLHGAVGSTNKPFLIVLASFDVDFFWLFFFWF